ncbi:MAG: methyltransferase domain-containing protein [Alkalimonas sp.]|nr:methyltransferase domain-containing protein [Alkalimonas sp.]
MSNQTDRNFDSIAAKFQRNIYQTSKGQLRQAVLLRDLATSSDLQQPVKILDVGAGQGQLALTLAAQGHQVTLADISAEMLQLARQTAHKAGLEQQLQFAHCSLQQLVEQGCQVPVVLCHAMLEWLADPEQAIAQLYQLIQPGGLLSLMFFNLDAKRFGNVLYGNFDYVAQGFTGSKTVPLSPQNPLRPDDVLRWCQQAGFELEVKTGVRCFHDYLREPAMQQSHYQQLLALELEYNQTEPYASLGKYMHFILRVRQGL